MAQRSVRSAGRLGFRRRYAGLMPSEVKRLRQLEEKNAKLKRLVADLSLDKAIRVAPETPVARAVTVLENGKELTFSFEGIAGPRQLVVNPGKTLTAQPARRHAWARAYQAG